MESLDVAKRWIHKPEFAEWRLIIIRFHRHIIRIASSLRFLQRRFLSLRVRAAMKHVVAIQGHSGAQFHERNRRRIVCTHQGSPVISKLHSSSHFGGEKGIRSVSGIDVRAFRAQIVADILFTADGGEEVVRVRRKLVQLAAPKGVRVSAKNGKDSPRRNFGSIPPRGGVERRQEAHISSKSEQSQHVLCALASSASAILVLDLHADGWATVLPKPALHLLRDLVVKAANIA